HRAPLRRAVYFAGAPPPRRGRGRGGRGGGRAGGPPRPGRAPDMHEEGCALLQLHAPVPETMLPAPAPDPLHIRRASGAMAAG
ncbi:MAG: hypothetical protein OXK17_10150, partial [Thaumarchaeota archaeon]|nr:hypothetical protein [Nitrososphaerota archaeon]